jgi:hypothetical protein
MERRQSVIIRRHKIKYYNNAVVDITDTRKRQQDSTLMVTQSYMPQSSTPQASNRNPERYYGKQAAIRIGWSVQGV